MMIDNNPLKIDTCVNDKDSCSNVFIWQDEKKQEYQLALRNKQACHAFEEMLCAVIDGCNTDTLCDMFNGMIENVISPLFPTRKHISKQRKNTQNFDKECKSLKYVVNNIAKQRDFTAWHGEYNIMLRQYKQLIQRKKRQYQQAKLSELENMRTEDPNSYWKIWKSFNPRNVTTGPTLANFVKYFEQQVYPPHVDYFDYEHMNNIIKQVTSFQHNVEHDKSNMTQFLNSPITAEEIKKAIQKLKCKKAAGVDGISAEFYKYGCNELLPALELLFNTILTNGEYPSRWATDIIHPVYKKGDHGVPDNYRKITVMPCIGKLFESILNNRLSFKNEVCNDNDPANNVLKETFSHLASQAGKAIFSLRKQSRPVVGKLSPTIAFKAFDCQILPILEYGSDIWYTGDDVNDLEKIHLKFIKSTLGVRKQTPTPAIYGDTGRFPLIIRQHIKAVKYWCRILKLSQSHPVRNAYNMLFELDGIGFTN